MSTIFMKRDKILSVVLSIILTLVLITCTTKSAQAAISGYGHRVTLTGSGSFTVNVTGKKSATGGITLKNWSTTSSDTYAYFTVERPNGTEFANSVYVGHNTEKKLKFKNATTGTYTIYYIAYAPKGTELTCYIY